MARTSSLSAEHPFSVSNQSNTIAEAFDKRQDTVSQDIILKTCWEHK